MKLSACSLDIVIPTYRRLRRSVELAESLSSQLSEKDAVYIIWQGFERPPVAQRSHIQCVFSSPPNLPRARNRGIFAGDGELILFLDDDVIPCDTLLEGHRRAYEDASIGAVAGSIDDPVFDREQEIPSSFDEETGDLRQNFSIPKSQYTISVMGANMSFRREVLQQIGYFDENFKRNALWEEIDCSFRVRRAGHKIWYCHTARVTHARLSEGGCRIDGGVRYLYHRFANTAYFACKHMERQFFGSWMTFWKYRLEYLSRKRMLWLRHDPSAVLAGIAGVLGGILRYRTMSKKT